MLLVGGQVLGYKYRRTPLSPLQRKIASRLRQQEWLDKPFVRVQGTENNVKIFLTWSQRLAQPRCEVKALALICFLEFLSHMLGKILRPPIHSCFTPPPPRRNLEVCAGHKSTSVLSAFTFGYSEPSSGGV